MRFHFGNQQMRTFGLVGREAAAMEGRAGTHSIRSSRRGSKDKRSAHAIAGGPHLAFLIHARLAVKISDKGCRIGERSCRRQGTGETHQPLTRRRIVEIRMFGGGRGFLGSIERIDHEHGVAGFGQAFSHLSECRTQAEDIRPDEHRWIFAFHRMHEIGIAGTVGCFDLDFRLGGVGRIGQARQQGGQPDA